MARTPINWGQYHTDLTSLPQKPTRRTLDLAKMFIVDMHALSMGLLCQPRLMVTEGGGPQVYWQLEGLRVSWTLYRDDTMPEETIVVYVGDAHSSHGMENPTSREAWCTVAGVLLKTAREDLHKPVPTED